MDSVDDPRSWHKRRDWEDQLRRAERWQHRADKALIAGLEGGVSQEGWDDVYAFFVAAYHVGDWLIADGIGTKAEWESWVDLNPEMSLCRDLCNGVKHRRLRKHEQVDESPWTQREFVPPNGERWFIRVAPQREFQNLSDVVKRVMWRLSEVEQLGLRSH